MQPLILTTINDADTSHSSANSVTDGGILKCTKQVASTAKVFASKILGTIC